MRHRLPVYSILIGFGFLAGAVFNFFDHEQASKVVPSITGELFSGFGMLWLDIAWFLLAFVLLHGLAGALFAGLARPVSERLSADCAGAGRLVLLLFLMAVLWVVLTSAAHYPNTLLGSAMHDLVDGTLMTWVRHALALVIGSAVFTGLLLNLNALRGAINRPTSLAGAILLAVAVLVAGWYLVQRPAQQPFPVDSDRPHVILIGIDGWRLDSLVEHGGMAGVMPFVDGLMAGSARAGEAVTPLARTYPAWWSVLSGQFPPGHGVRFNLVADEFIQAPLALPRQLGAAGYFRILAMDERRFANFREEHGFDRVVGPRLGAGDFLLGGLKDSPLSNLVVNTRLGRWLFPFSHGNRAAHATYRPQTFDRMLAVAIARAPRQPLMLAVHYELPHWPFQWAERFSGQFADHPLGREYGHYLETLNVVDGQIERLFNLLDELDVLDNAIVVLLSDHGEAFVGENRTWSISDRPGAITTPAGHGVHVFGLSEYRVPLAFRRFGGQQPEAGTVPGRASLADVYPTLADWLGLDTEPDLDGISLLPMIRGSDRTIPSRPLPVETGFNPDRLMASDIDEMAVLAEGLTHYRINRAGRLELKPESMPDLLTAKHRAVIYDGLIVQPQGGGRWLVANIADRTLSRKEQPDSHQEQVAMDGFCRIFRADIDYLPPESCTNREEGR